MNDAMKEVEKERKDLHKDTIKELTTIFKLMSQLSKKMVEVKNEVVSRIGMERSDTYRERLRDDLLPLIKSLPEEFNVHRDEVIDLKDDMLCHDKVLIKEYPHIITGQSRRIAVKMREIRKEVRVINRAAKDNEMGEPFKVLIDELTERLVNIESKLIAMSNNRTKEIVKLENRLYTEQSS